MSDADAKFDAERTEAVRLLEAMGGQEIENNPLSDADVRMFRMFEREGWDGERRRAYIWARSLAPAAE